MKRWVKFLVLVLVVGGLSGCKYAKQADVKALETRVDALQVRHTQLVSNLSAWAQATYDWEKFTYQTICDIVRVNGGYQRYGEVTQSYCGPTEPGGAPPPPPNWGQE